jgi:hypothetical protein
MGAVGAGTDGDSSKSSSKSPGSGATGVPVVGAYPLGTDGLADTVLQEHEVVVVVASGVEDG